jgi:hypothetical protein
MRPQVGGGLEVKIAEDREAGGSGTRPSVGIWIGGGWWDWSLCGLCTRDKPNRKLHYHLGTSSQHNVYESEIVGLGAYKLYA